MARWEDVGPEDKWPPPDLSQNELDAPDPADMLKHYQYELDQIVVYERMIMDVTRWNFSAFGAIAVLTPSLQALGDIPLNEVLVGSVIAVLSISIAASIFVLFLHKYIVAQYRLVKAARSALWRRRPFAYVEWKFSQEEGYYLLSQSASMGIWEFLKSGYVVKWINLLPALLSIGVIFTLYLKRIVERFLLFASSETSELSSTFAL